MERGWSAKGLLSPLYGRVGGRDQLAKRAGTNGSTLSSINTGEQNLGYALGRRLAAVLGVTLEELGAPADIAHPSPLIAELAEIKATLEAMNRRDDDKEQRIAGQLNSQTGLLAELGETQARLDRTAEALVTAAEDLRQASDALAKQARRRRPA